ncbi:MAG: hypothetical protein M1828_000995 [Chrysothrix sp. TS-e1954]|nr:MAG: hypothetical protein M1828_000995 [Chrysothrix sp. TS-e1954]
MDKARALFRRRPSYASLDGDPRTSADLRSDSSGQPSFSWPVYLVFMLLGVAMLWPWNGLMAASPYFKMRFAASKPVLKSFQPAELSVSTVANLASVLILAKLQANASYPRRIVLSLLINIVSFGLLAIFSRVFLNITINAYLGFLMVMVGATSVATGFMQNGALSYVQSYKRPEYMQSIMLGQAVAGVLPPIAQMATVLGAKEVDASAATPDASTSAFAYFLTAMSVSTFALGALLYLLMQPRTGSTPTDANTGLLQQSDDEDEPCLPAVADHTKVHTSVPLSYLASRLRYPAAAVFLTFAVTMVFPVFTQRITTTNPDPPPFLREAAFIPLGLLVWNAGDLVGRLLPLISRISLATRPKILLLLSIARFLFIPLYLMCNIQSAEEGTGSKTAALPDAAYLILVQLPFGMSNGYVGSCCMMGSSAFVEEDEAEPAGAFMGLVLVGGLAVGSLCSFFVGNG